MTRPRRQRQFDPYAILAALDEQRTSYVLIGAFARVIEAGPVAVLFPGQGSQRLGMGRRAHRDLPVWRSAFEEVAAELDGRLPRPIREVVWADPEGADAGLWLQGEMLARGLARVYSFPDNRALVAELLAVEHAARAAGDGIWADPWYRILTPADLTRELFPRLDSFQIVEGRVIAAERVGKRGYLNFGDDWKSDFTVSIDPAALRLFDEAGLPVASYQGRRVRVRGWVKSFNGPMIDATHPEQIEVLE